MIFRVSGANLNIRVYTPAETKIQGLVSDLFDTLDVPSDTYLVICEAKNQAQKIIGCWGYDRTQWLPYKPEYHNPVRLAPRTRTNIKQLPEQNKAEKQVQFTMDKGKLVDVKELEISPNVPSDCATFAGTIEGLKPMK